MNVNQKVVGTYCGKLFIGTIVESRVVTVATDVCFEFKVKLDAPIEMFGEARITLLVYTNLDGSPCAYTKFTDEMKLLPA